MKICFVSSYLPRECGIATYTDNLMSAIKSANPKAKTVVIAMDDGDNYQYSDSVIAKIKQNDNQSYIEAAKFVNNSDIDVVSIQHEFGIFGGYNGNKLLFFLNAIKKPVVITFHTVPIQLSAPNKIKAKKHKSRMNLIGKMLDKASAVTVMTETARKYLADNFKNSSHKISVVLHGAPEISDSILKKNYDKKDDFILSTFGLISPKKGLEYVISAMPEIIKANPKKTIIYLVSGKTHPKQPADYLNSLKELVHKLNLTKNIIFDSRYLDYNEIYRYLAKTDIYITPYYAKEQASSGTLSYAIAAGRCVVSTPYVFAEDVINLYKVGKLVKFKDSKSIAETVSFLINHPNEIKKCERNSAILGREIQWPKIGSQFLKIFYEVEKK